MLYVDSIITTAAPTTLRNMIGELYRGWINISSIVVSANSIGICYDWWSFDNSGSTEKYVNALLLGGELHGVELHKTGHRLYDDVQTYIFMSLA